MAHLYRPSYTRAIPPDNRPCIHQGKPAVKWQGRGKKWVIGILTDDGRCRVESAAWRGVWVDADGIEHSKALGRDETTARIRLAEIVRTVEQQKAGLLPVTSADANRPLLDLLGEYRGSLLAANLTEKHAAETHRLAKAILEEGGCRRFKDLDADRIARQLLQWRKGGMAVETSNHYTRAVKAFAAWLSCRLGSPDPLRGLSCLNAEVDRRRLRRVLTDAEFARLLAATRRGPVMWTLSGPDRAMLYLLAAYTGLRASELASLTPDSFHGPSVTVQARDAKGRRADTLPVPACVWPEVAAWLDTRPDGRLFPGCWAGQRHGSQMLRNDLDAAGIPQRTDAGTFDFHALRGQYITSLVRAGVPLATVQKLARHSDPKLTAQHYTRLGLIDLASAADRLSGPDSRAKEAA